MVKIADPTHLLQQSLLRLRLQTDCSQPLDLHRESILVRRLPLEGLAAVLKHHPLGKLILQERVLYSIFHEQKKERNKSTRSAMQDSLLN